MHVTRFSIFHNKGRLQTSYQQLFHEVIVPVHQVRTVASLKRKIVTVPDIMNQSSFFPEKNLALIFLVSDNEPGNFDN